MVFALLALEELGNPAARHAVAVITVTVLIRVVAHGATADPLATRYARLLVRQADEHASVATPGLPDRRLIRRVVSAHRARGAEGGGAGSGAST